MRYYKVLDSDGYIDTVGIGTGGTEITKTEYKAICHAIKTAPRSAPNAKTARFESRIAEDGNGGFKYIRCDLPDLPPKSEQEMPDAEAVDFLLHGSIQVDSEVQ